MNENVSNMYCSDSIDGDDIAYASEHPFDVNQSDDESDCYDEDVLNSYEPTMVPAPERTLSETWGARWVKGPNSVVLTSDKTFKETGHRTVLEWIKAEKESGEIAKQALVALEFQKKNDDKEAVRQERIKKEHEDTKFWASVPKFSRKRVVRMQKTEKKAFKAKIMARPVRSTRTSIAKTGESQKERDAAKKLTRTRRAAAKKANKTKEQEQENAKPTIPARVQSRIDAGEAVHPRRYRQVVDSNTNEVEDEYLSPTDLPVAEDSDDEAEASRVQAIQLQRVTDATVREALEKDQVDAKNRETFKLMESALHDERNNGSWSTVKTVKKKKKSPSKKLPTKRLDAMSLIKVTTERQVTEEKVENGRSKLVDTKGMRKSLVKSRMCRSVETGTVCPHGHRCRFAHSCEELVVADCFFSDACNRVRWVKSTGVFKNCGKNKCMHKHPGESKEQALRRVGIKTSAVNKGLKMMEKMGFKQGEGLGKKSDGRREPVAAAVKKDRLGVGAKKNPWGKKKTETWTSSAVAFGESIGLDVNAPPPLPPGPPPPLPRKKELCESVGTGRSCRHGHNCRFQHVDAKYLGGQLVFRVSQDMAMPTMQRAVARGLKNFRIEVV